MSRPEILAPPDLFYNEIEAKKYTSSSRIIEIQAAMTERALELLNIPPEKSLFILDIGCGSGLSGEVLTESGHTWVGMDISPSMLDVAVENETDGDLLLGDIGQGLPFRPGIFDAAISISTIQWLCNADQQSHNPIRRLKRFFQTLYGCLSRGAKAVLQFYPADSAQLDLITKAAMKAGFSGGVVIDYPHSTRAKKFFLCLFNGPSNEYTLPKAVGTDEEQPNDGVIYSGTKKRKTERRKKGKAGERAPVKSRDWVMKKKERQRKQGREVKNDSKYTARRRPTPFH
eukprot:TRINITY_DN7068_c0_g1_i1.p1 TRINITY_DN7068_c0_g1~~TRINITY_DN7068_c0_g1_i1.p1  ORF type:complete len:299 (-),score=76.18 TRINITY_DN7068_c0_g1_i1:91-948(-)